MKRTTKTQRTTARPHAANAETQARIEQYKQDVFNALRSETPMLTVLYTRLFDEHCDGQEIKFERCNDYLSKPETVKANAQARRDAWRRARNLFYSLAPIALHDLVQEIAAQVQNEFADANPIAADDVSTEIQRINIVELLRHDND